MLWGVAFLGFGFGCLFIWIVLVDLFIVKEILSCLSPFLPHFQTNGKTNRSISGSGDSVNSSQDLKDETLNKPCIYRPQTRPIG